jgi:signal transduction histidine kinase
MHLTRQAQLQLAVIAVVTVGTVAFHYGFLFPSSSTHHGLLHVIHGRLCYIPIILAATGFGVRGGLGVALAIIVLTLPYPRVRGITDRATLVGEYTEMVFYLAIGLTAGVLIEQQWRERRRREALQRELAQQERLSSLGQMAAGLAHEIKNPLGSIQGVAEILGDGAGDDPRKRELLGVLTKESRRLGGVVDHFLAFARPRPRRLATVIVNDAVERTASQMEIAAAARRVSVERRFAPDVPAIEADAEQLHQVFMNVILNAVAASPDGGSIVVATARREGGAVVTFTDRGPGIAAADLPRVFDPFFTTRDTGTGLGLSISHSIVEDHGGRIAIESEPGRGTVVTVTLPVRARESAHGT